jgi:transposase InsO family protein
LKKFRYRLLTKKDKGVLKKYIQKMTGYSRSQVTRLITQFLQTGKVFAKEYKRNTFSKVYAASDIALLAETDALHDYPNGAALKKILQRMAAEYKVSGYERIAKISVSHIYVLRHRPIYQRLNKRYEKTKPTVVNIGERRKPEPEGQAGYIRVDSVHQGDLEKDGKGVYMKGVYHINMVDEVTQFELVGAVEKISESYLSTILEQLLLCFPFKIHEFHSDNGSEYINGIVVQLLNKLLIKLTKSRSRKTNDNALVEGKNGSVIRKWMGYGYISQIHADRINQFYCNYFNEYLNYHRPCAFATDVIDHKGKVKKVYKTEDYMTPFDKLKSLPKTTYKLQKGVTIRKLERIAMSKTDNQMAQIVQKERRKLFEYILPISL